MARPPRDPSLLSWPWGSAPSGSGGPSSAVGLTSLPIVNSHAESAAMIADPMVGLRSWISFPDCLVAMDKQQTQYQLARGMESPRQG